MGKKTHEETKASGKPKKSLGMLGTWLQPQPPTDSGKRQQRTEVVVREWQNTEGA